MTGPPVVVNSRKYDGTLHKTWTCGLLRCVGEALLFQGEFISEIEHPALGVIRRGTVSYEYYWLDRWYSVFRFHSPNGELRNYYCNVNTPPRFSDGVLEYTDLDIDIVVWPDGKYFVLDIDEFQANAVRFGYPADVRRNALAALDEIKGLIESGNLPKD